MRGGAGDDTYVVDNAGDVVDETGAGSEGTDVVRSSVSFSLLDGAHAKGAIENLTLTGGDAVNATGNVSANVLIGNAAANILAGNLGNDFLTGAGGSDVFLFDTKLNKTANVDHITDMAHLNDFIELDHTIFSKIGIGTGHLKKSAFFAHDGAHKAHDGSDRVIYDKASGGLYYDKDGAGGHHAKLFAFLDGSPDDITAKDFLIVA
jgi:Ca2+-binding RTX toxin-like protein